VRDICLAGASRPTARIRPKLPGQRIRELDPGQIPGITDDYDYDYMDPGLVRLFEKLAPPHLGIAVGRKGR
jgi:hypothetical protein